MPSGILLPAANAMFVMSEPAAMPAPADTRNERRLNIFDPSSVLDAGVQAITPWRVKPPYVSSHWRRSGILGGGRRRLDGRRDRPVIGCGTPRSVMTAAEWPRNCLPLRRHRLRERLAQLPHVRR